MKMIVEGEYATGMGTNPCGYWELSSGLQVISFSREARNLGLCVKSDFKVIAMHYDFLKALNLSLKTNAIEFCLQLLSFT